MSGNSPPLRHVGGNTETSRQLGWQDTDTRVGRTAIGLRRTETQLFATQRRQRAKVTLSKYERPMKAQAIFNDSGTVTIVTGDGERHDFDSVSKAVAWCRANNVQAELA